MVRRGQTRSLPLQTTTELRWSVRLLRKLFRRAEALQKSRRLKIIGERIIDKIGGPRLFGTWELFFVKIHQLTLDRFYVYGEVGVPIGRKLLVGAVDYTCIIGV